MRNTLLIALLLVWCFASTAAAQTLFGVLNGTNESPGPGDADGFGTAEFRIEGTTIAYGIMVQNLTTPTASHIHRGAAGVGGPVAITLASSFPNNSQASTADIQASVGFRSNIGWFNYNALPVTATFEAHRASDGAVLGSVDVGIPSLSQLQQAVFSLISSVAATDQVQTDFYVTWASTIPIHVYAAVVDNKTGDVVYVN